MLKIFIHGISKCFLNIKEAFYRLYLWDIILSYFFQSDFDFIRLEPEYNSRNINHQNIVQIVDSVAVYTLYGHGKDQININREFDDLPLFFMEASNEPMKPEMSHKDELKIAILMTSALLKLISVCRSAGKEFLSNRKIYGLLIGATDIEVCVAFPVFDDVSEADWGPDICSHFIIVFQNSHKYWRQSLFNTEESPVDTNSSLGRHCVEGHNVEIVQPSESSVADFIKNQVNVMAELGSTMFNTFRSQSRKLIEAELKNSQNNCEHENTTLSVSELTAEINWKCLAVIKFVSDEVKKQAMELKKSFPDDNFGPFNDSFKFDFEQVSTMGPSKSKSSGQSKTPNSKKLSKMAQFESKSSENSPTSRKSSKRRRLFEAEKETEYDLGLLINAPEPNRIKTTVTGSVDPSGVNIVNVCKRYNPYELEIYQNQLIASSPFFPKFFNFELKSDQKIIILTLEKVQSAELYFRNIPNPIGSRGSNFHASILAKFLLDLFGAIRTLNRAGYVHSDISLNNVGYNQSKGVWQLFDFDSSLPIEESLDTERECGTTGFISRYAEKSGFFTISDDFISVQKCWQVISDDWLGEIYAHSAFEPIISYLSDEKSEDEKFNDDQLYLDTFDLYCSLSNFSVDTDTTDISYQIGKNICREIHHKSTMCK